MADRQVAILSLIESKFFKMHPLLKFHILFYSKVLAIYQYPSNGLPIWHGLPDIRPIEVTNS